MWPGPLVFNGPVSVISKVPVMFPETDIPRVVHACPRYLSAVHEDKLFETSSRFAVRGLVRVNPRGITRT